jgi:hypothetical protein
MIFLFRRTLILVFVLLQIVGASQVIKRDPRDRKDVANVFYNSQYTLFDLRSDEPIFPGEDGIYHIYYASNEYKIPRSFDGPPSKLESLTHYKFKDFLSCKLWCDGVPFTLSTENDRNKELTANSNNNRKEFTTGALDAEFEYLVALGRNWAKPVSQYDTVGTHNYFDFSKKPLSVLSKNISSNGLKLNVAEETKSLDNFLKGGDSLAILLANTRKKFESYPHSKLQTFNNTLNHYYRFLDQNKRIIVSTDNLVFDKLESMGELVNNRNFTSLIISYGYKPKKLERKLARILKKNKAISLNKENLKSYLMKVYNFNEDYLSTYKDLDETIIRLNKVMNYFNNYFLKLVAPQSYKNLSYIGSTINGVPNGYGLLLNERKQLLMKAYWDEGFPILLYSVSTYHHTTSEKSFYGYIVPESSNKKYKRRMINLIGAEYSKEKIGTFNIYVGECDQNNHRNGFGSYFFENYYKDNLQYYTGSWGLNGKRMGNGLLYNNKFEYDGEWNDNEMVSGKLLWPDKSMTYIGQFKDMKMHGFGELTYASGKVEEGLFENGSFVKSKYDIEQEAQLAIQKEEERILAEEKSKEELIKKQKEEESRKKREYEKAISCNYKFSKPNLKFVYVDNRKICCCCEDRYAEYSDIRDIEFAYGKIHDGKIQTELEYLYEMLNIHLDKTNANEEHRKSDEYRLLNFIAITYGEKATMELTMSYLKNKMFGNIFRDDNYGSKTRKLDKYVANSSVCKFCHRKCCR